MLLLILIINLCDDNLQAMHAVSSLFIWTSIGSYINSAESLEKYKWQIDIRINWK